MANKRIYVGNLPLDTTVAEVRVAFEAYGTVHEAVLLADRDTGKLKGFGFVEMDPDEADAAIEGLNDKDFGGQKLNVSEANDRPRGRSNSRYNQIS
jgi:RNA recognition motif-containing protein